MRIIGMFEQPWCFAILLGVALLLLIGAALVAREQRLMVSEQPASLPPIGFPADMYVLQSLASSAPFEALSAIQTRLQELMYHLPPNGEDARWLATFLHRLRATMDQLYDRLAAAPADRRTALLRQLAQEVAALDSVINLHLGVQLEHYTDREALEQQLAALRQSI